jgi:hypothetical protein
MDVQEPIVGIRIDDLIKLRGRRETSISPIQRFITVGKKIAIEKPRQILLWFYLRQEVLRVSLIGKYYEISILHSFQCPEGLWNPRTGADFRQIATSL